MVLAKQQLTRLPALREARFQAGKEAEEAMRRAEAASAALQAAEGVLQEALEVTSVCLRAMAASSPPPPALVALLAFKEEVDRALNGGALETSLETTALAKRDVSNALPSLPPVPPAVAAPPSPPTTSPRLIPHRQGRPGWAGEALITTLLGPTPEQEQARIEARRSASRATPSTFLASVYIPAVPTRLVGHRATAPVAPVVAAHHVEVPGTEKPDAEKADESPVVVTPPASKLTEADTSPVNAGSPEHPEDVTDFSELLPMDPREAARLRRETLLAAETAFALTGMTGDETQETTSEDLWSTQAESYLQAFALTVMRATTPEWSPFQACSILPEACVLPEGDKEIGET